MNWLYIGIAALSGAAMALQGTFNAALGKILGLWESTLVVHLIGTMVALLILIAGGIGFGNLDKLSQVPWWAYLGGVLSVVIIYAVARSIPQIGVSNATTAIIVAQVSTAVLIDCLGIFGVKKIDFQWIDLLGIALLAIGARILLVD
ncbi:MAG: DMT family transporter [Syntrophomonadaceae bacterium]|nr:DMT family transporter [Syntrophomonadaceae bacterium]